MLKNMSISNVVPPRNFAFAHKTFMFFESEHKFPRGISKNIKQVVSS